MEKKHIKAEAVDLNSEFSRLFWAARQEHRCLRGKSTIQDHAHKTAVAFCRTHGWTWAETLLEASRLNCTTEYEASLKMLAACENTVPEKFRGYFLFIQAVTLMGLGRRDEAIRGYRRALEAIGFDAPGNVWNNLGAALQDQGELDEAIIAYQTAFNTPMYGSAGHIWNNLGTVFQEKGKWDEAIESYRKALETPGYESPGDTWGNIGTAFHSKGELDEAIIAYQTALTSQGADRLGLTWCNLGVTLQAKGAYDKAVEAYQNALNSSDYRGFSHIKARTGLRMIESKLKPAALTPDDRNFIERPTIESLEDDPEPRIIGKVREAGETQYDLYLKKPDSSRDNTLSILRGWSSAVTLLEGSEGRWRGGGYFLKWKNFGIAIDPGFDFLRNFHDEKFHGREISAVIVSHNHPDHNDDLKSIDDLRYELYKRLAGKKGPGSKPFTIIWDEDTSRATRFAAEDPAHHFAPIAMPAGFPQTLDLSKHPSKIPVRIIPFKVNHGHDVPSALGMVIELLDDEKVVVRIGYTADTGYFEDLQKHLADCNLLIAHISQPSNEELIDATKFKPTHLGYRGVIRLLRECTPKLALIGEFWAGYADLRIDLTKGIRMRSGCKNVLPAGLGLHLQLPLLNIQCTECGCSISFADIKVAPPTNQYGNLAYLCPTCLLH